MPSTATQLPTRSFTRRRLPSAAMTTALLLAATATWAQNPSDPNYLDRELAKSLGPPHMAESARADIGKVVIISGRGQADEKLEGTYARSTLGLAGGAEAGRRMGTVGREIGGVPIYFPIPGAQIPGAIIGGLFGITQSQLQKFRDNLTEDLLSNDSPPLRSDGLSLDAFWEIRRRSELDSHLFSTALEIPEDADAVVYADFHELFIHVDGKDAIITTSVVARVFVPELGQDVYTTRIRYQDRDTLRNWTADDNAAWHSYQNFARYYLGRSLAGDLFNRIAVERELVPVAGPDTHFAVDGDPQHLMTDSMAPTLEWTYSMGEKGSEPALIEALKDAEVRWDLEIFDDRSLVYDAQELTEPRHRLLYPMEACGQYRWSVRPVYLLDGERRFGDWMQFTYERPPIDVEDPRKRKRAEKRRAAEIEEEQKLRIAFGKGVMGRQLSTAHAYTQDFATLDVACER